MREQVGSEIPFDGLSVEAVVYILPVVEIQIGYIPGHGGNVYHGWEPWWVFLPYSRESFSRSRRLESLGAGWPGLRTIRLTRGSAPSGREVWKLALEKKAAKQAGSKDLVAFICR